MNVSEMSDNNKQESRAERIARYKDTRRRQLAAQFGNVADSSKSIVSGSSSSDQSTTTIRTTRAATLRALANSNSSSNGSSHLQGNARNMSNLERCPSTSQSNVTTEKASTTSKKMEKDKSSKRKSNLNRCLTSEEVPANDIDDPKARRRRRRFFPQEILDQSSNSKLTDTGNSTSTASSHLVATTIKTLSPSPTNNTAITNNSNSNCSNLNNKKKLRKSLTSELSVHMENARRGVTANYSEMGRSKPLNASPSTTKRSSSSINKASTVYKQPKETSNSVSDRETIPRVQKIRKSSMSDNETATRNVAKRMEELTAITRETLARVERLTNSPRRVITSNNSTSRSSRSMEKLVGPSSILKKKSREETGAVVVHQSKLLDIVEHVQSPVAPVSILKRKMSSLDDQQQSGGGNSSTATPPVTFSPSVVEPSTSKRRQGILKKRRSLDESSVVRHRSCSPDVANKSADSRSILKIKRRSSLEELRIGHSPEIQLHGILKRKSSRNEHDNDEHSLNSPQSILKRRSGASSAGSTGAISNTPHVSITTAVILAAAGGAEMVLQSEMSASNSETVRPILKKKSFSDERSNSDNSSETPRPILKKKSSTDTDDACGGGEDRPKPILKMVKDRESLDTGQEMQLQQQEQYQEFRPILKSSLRAESPRPRLSFSNEEEFASTHNTFSRVRARRSNTICSDFNVQIPNSVGVVREENKELMKSRPLSVQELVKSFERTTEGKGAIPKRRGSSRHRTQPVTLEELEQSRHLLTSKHSPLHHNPANSTSVSASTTYYSENDVNSFLTNNSCRLYPKTSSPDASSSTHQLALLMNSSASPDSPPHSTKMSSDSAFQSLGDGLELDHDEDEKKAHVDEASVSSRVAKVEPMKLADQMKAIADEAKKMRLGKVNAGVERYRSKKIGGTTEKLSRFSTQPITQDEVKVASKLGAVKNDKVSNDASPERKGILRQPQSTLTSPPPPPRSRSPSDRLKSSTSRDSVLTKRSDRDDEGISSANNSDSDNESACIRSASVSDRAPRSKLVSRHDDSSEDGESSGAREVRSIFRVDKGKLNMDFKKTLEGVLAKSKSQGTCRVYEDVDTSKKSPSSGTSLRRSHTHTPSVMPQSIADLRAKLQESGETGWRKRITQNNRSNDELKLLKEKNRYNDELSEKTLLASKKDELDASSKQWKSRVEKTDAEKFTVAGRMEEKIKNTAPTINIPLAEKKTPTPKVYKGKPGNESSSTPTSPEKNSSFDLSRSKSMPYAPILDQPITKISEKSTQRKVPVLKLDDYTFKSFFESVECSSKNNVDKLDINTKDFDNIERDSLLVLKKNVQVLPRRRRGATTKNPIKALANRNDISEEYTEVITGVAEREKKRLNIEKLAMNSNKALEALAGLASTEDFKSVALKKSTAPTLLMPWKDLMLFQIKGRRHVQTRLVEPTVNSINEGDCFVLVTPSVIYNYIGRYSNVIEQSRAADVVNHIHKTNDMGCKNGKIVTISGQNRTPKAFWELLGSSQAPETVDAGHPEEDETYESNILSTNMIYTVENSELVPFDKYWGTLPKVEMLEENAVYVFDFGTEMYIWSGKTASVTNKKIALRLARDMWAEGYNYGDCNVCPLNIASILGNRKQTELPLVSDKRPDWALFAKITQHRETVLFREKFLDWPDYSRVIRVRTDSDNSREEVSAVYDIKPANVEQMINNTLSRTPDLVVEKTHLGRGDKYFDAETNRLFEFDTVEIKAWRITEHTHEELDESDIGHFYDTECYIYSWKYRQTVKGRELNGNPSKYAQVGRDKCVFFCWHGAKSSVSEKCTAAFLTVELDKENAPQVRVVQGFEPSAFLRLFNGRMVIHSGENIHVYTIAHLYILRGEVSEESYLMEVPAQMSSLRSRTSFIIIDNRHQVTVWHGSKSSETTRRLVKKVARQICRDAPIPFFTPRPRYASRPVPLDVNEGSENEDFFDAIGGNDRTAYHSILNNTNNISYEHTVRLFLMSSISGTFEATEVLCPYMIEHASPFPFVQSELYNASQPALFLLDNKHELWLWQGWWPEKEDDDSTIGELLSDQTGSGAVRWQAERRAAMQTAVEYWRRTRSSHDSEQQTVEAYLVWAGLEPLEFRNFFPNWEVKNDVAEINLKDGRQPDAKVSLTSTLEQLSRTTYPLDEILQRPLPEGVDPTQLEIYLSPDDFEELLSMSKEEFTRLPSWKRRALKKEKGLF